MIGKSLNIWVEKWGGHVSCELASPSFAHVSPTFPGGLCLGATGSTFSLALGGLWPLWHGVSQMNSISHKFQDIVNLHVLIHYIDLETGTINLGN